MAAPVTRTNQMIGLGFVRASHGASGGAASGITYDFTFSELLSGSALTFTNQTPQRDVPADMEVTRLAPDGWPASMSFFNGALTIVLWPGGEQYGTEECP